MLFNTLDFALFFGAVFLFYHLLPARGHKALLLGASYFFYGYWDWRFLGLMWISTLAAHFSALAIERAPQPKQRRLLLGAGLGINLIILGVFKYYNFFADTFALLLESLGIPLAPQHLRLALPVGISFYTFQAIGYIVDVYRGSLKAESRLWDTALFIVFFPQLVAGPIERVSKLLPQLKAPRKLLWKDFFDGTYLIFWGLFKKVFIADNLASFVEQVFDHPYEGLNGLVVGGALYAFALQIYCDFSGYTDIARGAARFFGIELTPNFHLPYLATSPRDFWRRWHISLSEWLRDYLYIPLGGSRGGSFQTYRNLFLTMLLGGLWHGANWTFVLWGAYHGALLMIHRAFEERLKTLSLKFPPPLQGAWWALRVFTIFHLVCLGWLIFRARSVSQVVEFCQHLLFHFELSGDALALGLYLGFYAWPLILMQAWQGWKGRLEVMAALPWPARSLLYALGFFLLVLFGAFESREFIYFQF